MSIRGLIVMLPVLLAVDACVVRISSSGGKDERSNDDGGSNDTGSVDRTDDNLSSNDSASDDRGGSNDRSSDDRGGSNDSGSDDRTSDGGRSNDDRGDSNDSASDDAGAPSAAPVVADDVDACRLVNTHDDEGVIALGFPRASTRLPATGRVQVNVLLTDFPDVAATLTPAEVFALVSPGSEQLFADMSYGALDLVYEPHLQWLRMSQPSSSYSFVSYASHKAYIEEAVVLAGDAVDWSQTDGILVLATPEITTPNNGPAMAAGPDFGINAGGRLIHNAVTSGADLSYWGYPWANHELGHTLGLVDLYLYEDYSDSGVGIFGLMGNQGQSAPELFAFERWNLGWIEDSQVACATASGTALVQLSPVERSGGTKQLVVPLSATAAVVAESRHIEGHDSDFTPGVLVYFVDTALDGGRGVIRVLPLDDDDQEKRDAPLQVGESITHEGVTITVTDTGDYGEWVEITR